MLKSFAEERSLIILSFSAVGPRGTRITYGCVDTKQLFIEGSKLYDVSCEEFSTAESWAKL